MSRHLMTTVCLVLLCGCKQNTIEPSQNLAVNTDNSVYSLNQMITVSLHNGSPSTCYFGHCNYRLGFYIQRKVDGGWLEKSSVAVICLGIYPSGIKAIPPGVTNTDIISIADSGTYRLKYPFGWQQSNTSTDSLLSNEFSVH